MWPPPLLRDRSLVLQLVLAVVLPTVFGIGCGVLLGTSGLWFHIVVTAGGLGGVNAGFEHDGWRGGLLRGAIGGPLFAIALVATHDVRGVPASAHLPLSLPFMTIFYASMSVPLGALGGWLRRRRELRSGPRPVRAREGVSRAI